MGMNQPPQDQQAMMAQPPIQQDPSQDPSLAATGGHPLAQHVDQTPDPSELLPELINQYIDYGIEVRQNKTLAEPVRSKIMMEVAQSLNFLLPNLPQTGQLQQQAQEMQMKQEQHQSMLAMQLQKHQADLQMQAEKHQMDIAKSQHEIQQKAIEAQINAQMKQQEHHQGIVHDEQSHQQQLKQQKQAAQSKPTNNNSNKHA